MNSITLTQAATLLVRFFGFYLLFYLPFNLTEFPAYWLRSSFSHVGTIMRVSHDPSYDVSFLMFCIRQIGYLFCGIFFFRRPQKLAGLLMDYFGDRPA